MSPVGTHGRSTPLTAISARHPPAKILDPWPAVRDPGGLKRGFCGLEVLSGVGIRGPGPWAVVRAAGAMVSMACGIQISCLAMKKAAMNAAIILRLGVS